MTKDNKKFLVIVDQFVHANAVKLKKEQPYRSQRTINRFLQDM